MLFSPFFGFLLRRLKEDPVKDCIDAAQKAGIPVVKTDKHELNGLAGQRPHQVRSSDRKK